MRAAPSGRPTLEAVAAHAGVSRATVSRVVNGGAGVREEVRERVLGSVEALGYVPNNAARTLVTRRTGAVAVVIAEPESRVFADPFFAQQLRGISRELSAHDIQLLLTMLERDSDQARVGRYLSGGHVDGTLLFSLHGDDPPEGFRAGSAREPATLFGLPTVFGGRPGWPGAEDDPGLLYVDTDNRDGARQAVAHLLERGRRCVGAITGPLDQTSAVDRLRGYRDALAEAGVGPDGRAGSRPAAAEGADLVAYGQFTAESGERAMAELLDRRPDLDAVFAGNDLMATGALRTLRAHGRRVPEEVAVVGYDDLEAATWSQPALTTVRQDVEGMGGTMARLLLSRLGPSPVAAEAGQAAEAGPRGGPGRRPAPVITPARLVVRDST